MIFYGNMNGMLMSTDGVRDGDSAGSVRQSWRELNLETSLDEALVESIYLFITESA